jgi:hypothetical protein
MHHDLHDSRQFPAFDGNASEHPDAITLLGVNIGVSESLYRILFDINGLRRSLTLGNFGFTLEPYLPGSIS